MSFFGPAPRPQVSLQLSGVSSKSGRTHINAASGSGNTLRMEMVFGQQLTWVARFDPLRISAWSQSMPWSWTRWVMLRSKEGSGRRMAKVDLNGRHSIHSAVTGMLPKSFMTHYACSPLSRKCPAKRWLQNSRRWRGNLNGNAAWQRWSQM